MQSRDFAFWLQGFFELGGGQGGLTAEQVVQVKQHLSLVFKHDPAMEHDAPKPLVPLRTIPLTPPHYYETSPKIFC